MEAIERPTKGLAVLDGASISADTFRAFIDAVRLPGYRPATLAEAERLLWAQLRVRHLDGEAVARGFAASAEGRSSAYSALVAEHGSAAATERAIERGLVRAKVEIDREQLVAFVAAARPGGPLRPPGSKGATR